MPGRETLTNRRCVQKGTAQLKEPAHEYKTRKKKESPLNNKKRGEALFEKPKRSDTDATRTQEGKGKGYPGLGRKKEKGKGEKTASEKVYTSTRNS